MTGPSPHERLLIVQIIPRAGPEVLVLEGKVQDGPKYPLMGPIECAYAGDRCCPRLAKHFRHAFNVLTPTEPSSSLFI